MKTLTALMVAFTLIVTSGGVCFAQNYLKGYYAVQKGDYPTALREFRALAMQGNALGQYSLGVMYQKSMGVPKDYSEAVKWFQKSAEQGYRCRIVSMTQKRTNYR